MLLAYVIVHQLFHSQKYDGDMILGHFMSYNI